VTSARAVAPDPVVRVVPKHHALVRLTHWINLPLLLLLIASGLSIYWASPVFQHARDPVTGSREYLADIGIWIARTLRAPGQGSHWIYDHLGLGTFQLAPALRLHWLLAYLFMLNGALYVVGLAAGGGWRALVPRRSDIGEALAMMRFYIGVVPMAILRRPWPHPPVRSKYNALQRAAYVAVPLAGALAVLSGWAMHKPVQLGWLERLFVSYDGARVVHFLCMLVLAGFVIPHVILVIADGWDTFRSMVTGWSMRVRGETHERA
jgi:thiosulfate reductase cytochrome b subunit